MGEKIKVAVLVLCVLAVGHLEYRDEQDRIRFERMEEAQQMLDRDFAYWMPAPTECDSCHTVRGTKLAGARPEDCRRLEP